MFNIRGLGHGTGLRGIGRRTWKYSFVRKTGYFLRSSKKKKIQIFMKQVCQFDNKMSFSETSAHLLLSKKYTIFDYENICNSLKFCDLDFNITE